MDQKYGRHTSKPSGIKNNVFFAEIRCRIIKMIATSRIILPSVPDGIEDKPNPSVKIWKKRHA